MYVASTVDVCGKRCMERRTGGDEQKSRPHYRQDVETISTDSANDAFLHRAVAVIGSACIMNIGTGLEAPGTLPRNRDPIEAKDAQAFSAIEDRSHVACAGWRDCDCEMDFLRMGTDCRRRCILARTVCTVRQGTRGLEVSYEEAELINVTTL